MNRVIIRSNMLAEMEHEMQVIKRNLKLVQDQSKSYENQHRAFK